MSQRFVVTVTVLLLMDNLAISLVQWDLLFSLSSLLIYPSLPVCKQCNIWTYLYSSTPSKTKRCQSFFFVSPTGVYLSFLCSVKGDVSLFNWDLDGVFTLGLTQASYNYSRTSPDRGTWWVIASRDDPIRVMVSLIDLGGRESGTKED